MKPEYNATDPLCNSGEQPQKVFLWMKWVENGRFEVNIGGIEAEWLCGPFREVVDAKTALRDRFAARAATPGPGGSLSPLFGVCAGVI